MSAPARPVRVPDSCDSSHRTNIHVTDLIPFYPRYPCVSASTHLLASGTSMRHLSDLACKALGQFSDRVGCFESHTKSAGAAG